VGSRREGRIALAEKETRICPRCETQVPRTAAICSACGSHRSKWRNRVDTLLKVASGLTVFVALATIIISFLPAALTELVDRRAIEVVALERTSNRQVQNITLVNTGLGSAFIHDLTFYPDEDAPRFKPIRLPLNVLIKEGEGHTRPIGRKRPPPSFVGVSREGARKRIAKLNMDDAAIKRCFRMELADLQLDRPALGQHVESVLGSIVVRAEVTLVSTRTHRQRVLSMAKRLSGSILFDERSQS